MAGRSTKWAAVAAAAAAAAIVVVVVLLVTSGGDEDPGAPVRQAKSGTPFFGVNESQIYQSQQFGEQELADTHAAAMADAGIEWVRVSTAWRGEEPNFPAYDTHTFDWTFLDGVVGTLAEHDLPVQLTLFTTPNWAAENPDDLGACGPATAPTSDPIGLPAYAGAVAERYGDGGAFWAENPDIEPVSLHGIEIWNEPNWNAFWCPTPEPDRYADLFVESAKAIEKVDPKIRIVTGGLTSVFADDVDAVSRGMDANEFMAEMVKAQPEVADLADAIGFHPYAEDVPGVFERISRFRDGLDDIGLSKVPIEISEAGWPTQGDAFPVDEDARAELTQMLADEAWQSACGIDGIALYAWRTPESVPDLSDEWYGIADPASAELRPAASAYSDAIASARKSKRPSPSGDC